MPAVRKKGREPMSGFFARGIDRRDRLRLAARGADLVERSLSVRCEYDDVRRRSMFRRALQGCPASVSARPPDAEMIFNLPWLKNPIRWPGWDQNGN